MAPYRHQQRKQHLFQLDAGRLEDLLIAHRLVHHADDIQQRTVFTLDKNRFRTKDGVDILNEKYYLSHY